LHNKEIDLVFGNRNFCEIALEILKEIPLVIIKQLGPRYWSNLGLDLGGKL